MSFWNYMKKTFNKYFVPHAENEYKPHFLRERAVLSMTLLAVLLLAASALGNYAVKNNKFLASIQEAFLVDLTNDSRAELGLNRLALNDTLTSAANMKALDMSAKGYFAHVSPEGLTPWYWIQKAGYNYLYAGENLAVNFNNSQDVEEAWMNSPTHKANILSKNFSEIGIATSSGIYKGEETIFVVQMFGSPRKTSPATTVPTAPSQKSPETVKSVVATESANQNNSGDEAVLGEQVENFGTGNEESFMTFVNPNAQADEVAAAQTQTEESPAQYTNWLERLIVSPGRVVNGLYVVLIAVIVFALILKIFIEIRLQHPKNIFYGVLLLIIVLVFMYMNRALLVDPIVIATL